MSTPPRSTGPAITTNSAFTSIEAAIARLEGSLGQIVRSGALAGAMALVVAPSAVGCAAALADGEDEDLGESSEPVIGDGQPDWAQQEGQRNTAKVSYYREYWTAPSACNSRFCTAGLDVFIKIRVQPAVGANLDQKRIGVVYRAPGTSALTTVVGQYFATWGNGDEEWHVKISFPSNPGILSFNAWYQDGLGGTFYDDNSGELHPIATGSSTNAIVRMGGGHTTVAVTSAGVQGAISARLADLDFDKEVAMVYTTDDWQTAQWMNMGPGQNEWRWAEDYGADYERWQIDVDLPGDFQRFQYAMVYRHGVAGGASSYEFWDSNNNQNYVVNRQ